ncbi:MAG: hypothetical protein RL326_2023, partial [Pseudomonadota bacterium]
MSDVLLVDDDGELIHSLARVLSTLIGSRTLSATTTAERASQILSADKPLVVVLDLCIDERIGVESGFNLLSKIVEYDSTARVIVLTGHGSSAHGIRALQL